MTTQCDEVELPLGSSTSQTLKRFELLAYASFVIPAPAATQGQALTGIYTKQYDLRIPVYAENDNIRGVS